MKTTNQLKWYLDNVYNCDSIKEDIFKYLDAIEIIKNKKVNVANLIDWFNNSREVSYTCYVRDYYQEGWFIHFADNDEVDTMYNLTYDEFVLLKEVFNNDKRSQ